MIKLVYIYRTSRSGAYSIEGVFRSIANELRKNGITVIEYEIGPRFRILFDIFHLRKLKADIYHITGDVNYLALFLPSNKIVLTIHDIGHYLYGLTGWKKNIYKWLWVLLPSQFSSKVTVVSNETKNKILENFSIAANMLTVIENCYSPSLISIALNEKSESLRILQVGTGANKNVPRLIEAIADTPCVLVLIGKITDEIEIAIKTFGIKYENYVDVTRDFLIEQYASADIVAFVSIHEGFGMPIIEAQALGRALITSELLPMSDVAGNGACLVNPLDVNSIRESINMLLYNSEYRDSIINAGLVNVRRFRPETVASKYIDLYKIVSADKK